MPPLSWHLHYPIAYQQSSGKAKSHNNRCNNKRRCHGNDSGHRRLDDGETNQAFGYTLRFLGLLALFLIAGQSGKAWTLPQTIAFSSILLCVGIATLQARHYLLGLAFWTLILTGLGSQLIPTNYLPLELFSFLTLASCSIALLLRRLAKQLSPSLCVSEFLRIARKRMGLDSESLNLCLPETKPVPFNILALFLDTAHDLSLFLALLLAVGFHLPSLCYSQIFGASLMTPVATILQSLGLYGLATNVEVKAIPWRLLPCYR